MLNFNDNPGKIFAAHELAAVVDSAMATKMTVQFNLFGMSSHNYVSLLWGDRVAWDGLSVCGGWWSPQPPTQNTQRACPRLETTGRGVTVTMEITKEQVAFTALLKTCLLVRYSGAILLTLRWCKCSI